MRAGCLGVKSNRKELEALFVNPLRTGTSPQLRMAVLGPTDGPTPTGAQRRLSRLALLWQIYSRCFCLPIQTWQYGHRRGLDRMMRSTMAWRMAGSVG